MNFFYASKRQHLIIYIQFYSRLVPKTENMLSVNWGQIFMYKLIFFGTSKYKFIFHFQSHKLCSLIASLTRRFYYTILYSLCWCTQISYCLMSYSLLTGIHIEQLLLHKTFLGNTITVTLLLKWQGNISLEKRQILY